eukprot:UN33684
MLLETEMGKIHVTKLQRRKSVAVSRTFNGIIKVMWHPNSSTHIGLLTKNRFRLLNVTFNSITVEEKIALNTTDIVDFTFGCPRVEGWSSFTVFLLHKTGKISVLTPINR